MSWCIAALKKYAVFSGRARRKEYWYFALFYLIIYIVLSFIDRATGTFNLKSHVGLLTGIFALAMVMPSLAVSVRRLHDTDRTGWWLLIGFVPLIGAIVLLVFFVLDGTPETNRFGQNPKEAA